MKNLIKQLVFLSILSLIAYSCSSNKESISGEYQSAPSKEVEDLVFVLDISSSMLAQDFEPNRLEAVKTILDQIIKRKESYQQMSIVVFANEATIICPLTEDITLLSESLERINVGVIEDGTAIGKGIMFALYELSKSENKKKGIVVLTDGINNSAEYPVSYATQLANQQNIQISSIGVGCMNTALSPISRRSDGAYVYGNIVVEIDEELLKAIGTETQGDYYRVTCNSDLENFQDVSNLFDEPETKIDMIGDGNAINQEVDSLWQKIKDENVRVLNKLMPENDK